MIIRAVSDDDDGGGDDERDAHPLVLPLARADGRVHAAKLAWLGVSLALAALLLADLAAVLSIFARPNPSGAAPEQPRDAFALVPVLLSTWFSPVSSDSGAVFAAPATMLNNLFGYIAVAVWIYSREANAHRDTRARSPQRCALRSPWAPVSGVLCFGHAVSCVYILAALFESDGDPGRFFLGKARGGGSRTYPRV